MIRKKHQINIFK